MALKQAIAAMKALKRIQLFDGSSDVERWINRIELAIEIDGKEDKAAQIISMNLGGPAYDTWMGLTAEERKDPESIKAALRRVYGLRVTDAWQSALASKIMLGENLDVAGERIVKFVRIATADADPVDRIDALMFFFNLPSNIREQVSMKLGDKFTYREVLSCAKTIWPSNANAVIAGGFQNVRNYRSHQDSSGSSWQNSDRESKRCSCCSRVGHLINECRVRCFSCGKQGHMKRNCQSAVPLNARVGASDQVDAPEREAQ